MHEQIWCTHLLEEVPVWVYAFWVCKPVILCGLSQFMCNRKWQVDFRHYVLWNIHIHVFQTAKSPQAKKWKQKFDSFHPELNVYWLPFLRVFQKNHDDKLTPDWIIKNYWWKHQRKNEENNTHCLASELLPNDLKQYSYACSICSWLLCCFNFWRLITRWPDADSWTEPDVELMYIFSKRKWTSCYVLP